MGVELRHISDLQGAEIPGHLYCVKGQLLIPLQPAASAGSGFFAAQPALQCASHSFYVNEHGQPPILVIPQSLSLVHSSFVAVQKSM